MVPYIKVEYLHQMYTYNEQLSRDSTFSARIQCIDFGQHLTLILAW